MQMICIGGNTGAGKSTMILSLAERLKRHSGVNVRVFDEKEFHHQYLSKMFADSGKWALPIQMNFLFQRTMALLAVEDDNATDVVVMERSIFEDEIFFQYYVQRREIPVQAVESYRNMQLWSRSVTAKPNVHIYLRENPALCHQRIVEDFTAGRREGEYTGDRLRQYVGDINAAYESWFDSYGRHAGVIAVDAETLERPTEAVTTIVLGALNST